MIGNIHTNWQPLKSIFCTLCIAILTVHAGMARAQTGIKGKITDTWAKGLPGVVISIKDSPLSVLTNKKGEYFLKKRSRNFYA